MSIHDRGFASMSPEKQRAIAALGGRAAQAKGKGHQWTREEARAAGAKGGERTAACWRARRAQTVKAS